IAIVLPAARSAAQKSDEISRLNKCWDYWTDSSPEGVLSFDRQRIYFAVSGGAANAVDVGTGKIAWSAELGGRINSNILVRENDLLISTTVVADQQKPSSAVLRSLSKETGIVNWSVSVTAAERLYLRNSSTGLAVISSGGGVEMLNARDGTRIWNRPAAGVLSAAPADDDRHVAVATRSGEILVMSLADGSVVSKFKASYPAETIGIVEGRSVIYGDGRGNLVSYGLESGTKEWKIRAGAKWSYIGTTDEGIAAVSADNFVYMVAPERGNVLWKRRLPGRVAGAPAISEKFIITASYGESSAYVIDLEKGRFVNQIVVPEKHSFSQSPVFVTADSAAAITDRGITLWSFAVCPENKKAAPATAPPS
ncbi:MAG TPA: PQQ-binding-like beta-propeller repeat protein, partial [Pyrinomonadaceae bacterium]|nr:PQQ-binding-like beta-propeller repeat protein [Pyrinomonadaceae bacterium]